MVIPLTQSLVLNGPPYANCPFIEGTLRIYLPDGFFAVAAGWIDDITDAFRFLTVDAVRVSHLASPITWWVKISTTVPYEDEEGAERRHRGDAG